MADPKGFMKTPRLVAERRPVAERIRDWLRISIGTEADCAALLAATADLVAH